MLIKTPRLIIREFKMSDWKAVHSYASNFNVVKYTDWGPNTEKQTKEFIKQAIKSQKESTRKNFELAVTLKNTGTIIGTFGLHIISHQHKKADIGYVFHPDSWGRGYATEAGQAVLKFSFKKLKLHRLSATCDVLNKRSKRVLKKLGLRREGQLRQDNWLRDHWRDTFIYGILESDWRNPSKKIALVMINNQITMFKQ